MRGKSPFLRCSMSQILWSLADNLNPKSMSSRLRSERVRKFSVLLRDIPRTPRILDIGGTPHFWAMHRHELPLNAKITLLNLAFDDQPGMSGTSYVTGDVRDMSMFDDAEFDICFSNSVIEHLGSYHDQLRMAQEIRRVARGYYVQTPNLYFPVEPHFLVPGWQFIPFEWRARILHKRDLGWIKQARTLDEARVVVRSIRLLNSRSLQSLFPDGRILREWVGPLTKSLVAWRPVGWAPTVFNRAHHMG
jgi:hypothetical protein